MVLHFEMNMTLLHLACQSGSRGITNLLIESGTDINAKTNTF